MKKRTINFSWPACLSDFSKDTVQENFSRGKLKVFYKGETADHRYFSDAFSQELVKSLPYTPVVSYYDEKKDDFVGHATEQQILGIVDPCIEPQFEQDEDGIEWCVCDVVLYTERPDKVGDIAKKIVGHKQSLELDPSSVKYTINYDSKRHFKNVEFTAGRFVGVSVLGNNQKPAFTGSEFFAYNDQFESKMQILREYCEAKHDEENRGNEMNLQEFMKLSWGDISVKVEEAIRTEYQEEAFTQIIDMFDDSAIVRFYSYIDDTCKLMRVKYSYDDNGTIVLGDVNEVYIVYEDVAIEETGVKQTVESDLAKHDPEPEESSEPDDEEQEDKEEEEFTANNQTDLTPKVIETEVSRQDAEVVVDNIESSFEGPTVDAACANAAVDAAQVTNAEVTFTDEKVSVDNEQNQKENSSATSFAESERAKLKALEREKKINLLDEYKECLTDNEYADFMSRLDGFESQALELDLLKKYKIHSEQAPQKPMRAFALFAPKTESAKIGLDDLVRKYIH